MTRMLSVPFSNLDAILFSNPVNFLYFGVGGSYNRHLIFLLLVILTLNFAYNLHIYVHIIFSPNTFGIIHV